MRNKVENTKFASPTRSQPQEIAAARGIIIDSKLFTEALNLFPEVIMILDQNRQTVYCNQQLLHLLGIESPDSLLGKRPGEIFHCIHAEDEPAGCGTSEFCKECGAVQAILTAQKGQKASNECRITIHEPSGKARALDLRVWAIPVTLKNIALTFFVIRDIQDEKRRAALERVFFHDVLNDTAILKGYAENAKDGFAPKTDDVFLNIFRFTERLSHSILEQRDLLNAEEGTYQLKLQDVDITSTLHEFSTFYEKNQLAINKKIVVKNLCPGARIHTDPVLFWRILGNLVKNALEAASEGDTIALVYQEESNQKIFSVHNPSVMTEEVRHQIFQRSFSTKGRGRGLGTYSVKLFTEQYLKGKAWFESIEGKGTTFFVSFNTPAGA